MPHELHVDPRRLLNVASVVVVHIDATGSVRWVNRTFERLTRWSRERATGRDWLTTFIPANERRHIDMIFGQTLSGNDTSGTINGLLTRDGGTLFVEWHNSVLDEGDGRSVVAVGVDVTARLQAERDLRDRERDLSRSRERLAEAQRIAKIGSWDLEIATNDLVWSDEIFRIFELDPARFGASYDAFLHLVYPEDRAAVDAAYRSSIANHAPYEIVHRLLMADGRIKWVHERGETVYEPDGRPLRSVGTVQDVTTRVLAEQAAALKTAAIESSINAIAFADLEGAVTYVNETFVRLWGAASRDELVGRKTSDLWAHPDGRGLLELTRDDEGFSGDVTATALDGATRTLQVSTNVVKVGPGLPAAVMASFLDLTTRIEMERQLEAQLREKEVLLREIHHRVKNNLQIISSLLHFESKRRGDPRLFDDLRKRILAMKLVHERLYHAKNLALVDLGDYVQSLVRAILTSFDRGQDVRLEVTVDELALPIEVALPAGMIVSELVTNVLKYAFRDGRDGAASVSVRADGDRVHLEVGDDGPGFPEGFQLAGGRGFGLELVRTLTEQLGGELEAGNRGGAHVRVSFPVVPERPEAPGDQA